MMELDLMDVFEVIVSKKAEKQLRSLPAHVVIKLQGWISGVKIEGLRNVRKIPGFHDEPLRGKRQGQRSIRLSKGYRACYIVDSKGNTHIAEIKEVNKHEY